MRDDWRVLIIAVIRGIKSKRPAGSHRAVDDGASRAADRGGCRRESESTP